MLEVLSTEGSAVSEHLEEEPLQLPSSSQFSAALSDALPTVELEGERASVRQVMLEGLGKSGNDRMLTRIDVRDLNYSIPIAPPSLLPIALPLPFRELEHVKHRAILKEISFSLFPGETTLLLGGPRSGKTSLLECIAGRQTSGVTGEVFIDGVPPKQAYQRMVSYAMQGDAHAARLTVKETLLFSAWCQMPTADERLIERRVEAVLQLLGLKHAEETFVGGFGVPGVSGGEKRRCSIGIEWVKGPRFFLLDEPTTGLDSGAALNIGRCLRAISGIGTPVLCALLQPSWDLVRMFDKILMIAGGEIVYWGPVSEVLGYFASLGFHCPLNYSAAEFLSEVVDHPHKFEQDLEARAMRRVESSTDFVSAWKESDMRTRILAAAAASTTTPLATPSNAVASSAPIPPPSLKELAAQQSGSLVSLAAGDQAREVFARSPLKQFSLLMWRDWLLLVRDQSSLIQQLVADVLLAVVTGLLFFQLGSTQTESIALFGLVWFLVSRLAFQSLATMAGPYMARPYLSRQRAGQYYQMLPYVASRVSLQVPLRMLQAIIGSTIVYWLAGLWQTAGHYFFAMLVLAMQSGNFVVLAHGVSAFMADPLNASLAASTLLCILILFSGFLIIRTRLPNPYIWLYYVTPMKYAGDAMMINEFHDRTLTCTGEELMPPSSFVNLSLPYPDGFNGAQICRYVTGDQLLESRGLRTETSIKWIYVAALFGYFALFCLIYYVAVRLVRWPASTRAAGPPPRPSQQKDGKAKRAARSNPQSATLSWRDLEYSVPLGNGRKTLLSKVNGYVQPGMLLALMGPSGAGKTTLLDVLAARKNIGVVSGDIRINGKPLTPSYPRLIGYVEQFDMHYPLQTVQEALWFAAKSRLPAALTDAQKSDIVDDIVALLEMEPLRNMIVAALNSEEQKRLSMGVELASMPAVLFLDEPTSGLDSNGADRVMAAIEKIAQSGTSVICTIHQPSSRIFFRATHLLLLRNPGQVVYFGELGPSGNTVIQYFRRLGLVCPHGMNPADFVLEASLGHLTALPSHPSPAATTALPEAHAQLDVAAAWSASQDSSDLVAWLDDVDRNGPSIKPHDDPVFAASLQHRYALGWLPQFGLLWSRWMRALIRAPTNTYITLARALLIGFVFGTAFWRRPHDQMGAQELTSVMFIAAIFSFLTAFAYIPAFYIQRAIFYRERAELMYQVSSWGISRAIMDLPSVLMGNFLVGVLIYWLAGLRADAGAFFFFMLVILTFGCVALVFAQMLSAVFAYIDVVGLVFASTFASFALAAGFLIPRPHIRVWMRWLHWGSFTRYYLEALVVNEIKADTFHCGDSDGAMVPVDVNGTAVMKQYCPITSGSEYVRGLGLYDELHYWDVLILGGFWVLMMFAFLVSLRVFKHIKR